MEEGVDYYWVEKEGIRHKVFTKEYLLKRGFCCVYIFNI